jgi:hypothetical protein
LFETFAGLEDLCFFLAFEDFFFAFAILSVAKMLIIFGCIKSRVSI